jgi:PAS domain S-box-containing protein
VSQRERALDKLQESEERYRALVEASPSMIAVVQDGRFVYINRAGARLLGYETPKDAIGISVVDTAAPEFQSAVAERLRYLEEGLENPLIEVELVKTDGTGVLAETTSVPIALGGKPGALIIGHDITERKSAEQRIQRARKDWEDIFQAIGHPTVILDPQHTVLAANRATAAATGRAEHELIGKKCHEIFHEGDSAPESCPLLRLKQTGAIETGDMEISALGGHFLVSCTPVTDDAGHLRRVIHISTEITERKRAEDALRGSEELFRATFEQAAVGIALAQIDGPFQRINQRFCDITGYTLEEMLSLTYHDITHPDDREATRDWVDHTLADGQPPPPLEKRYVRKDGQVVWVNVTLSHVRDEHGNAINAIGIVEDITARKRAEEQRSDLEAQLRQSQKMEAIGQLAGGVAHDFNNLLAPIMVYSDLLLQELSPSDPRHHELEQINQAADRARRLTRQLLAFGRKQMLTMKSLHLNQLLLDLQVMLKRTMPENIDIELRLSDERLLFGGDLSQIEQVVMNLAINARDAMPDGGSMIIETGAVELDEKYAREHAEVSPGAHVMLVLSDTGHGMDPATTTRVFEPFFTTKERDKGTGLGLSTVYGIVKQHGGNIRVYSEPERGTTFKIYFPRLSADSSPAEAAVTFDSIGGTETLLVAEDDAAVRETACTLLERLGYQVFSAASGARALEVAAAHEGEIVLLLSDVIMPGMNGRELYEKLAVTRPDLRVLYMSGYTEEAIARHGVLRPGTALLQKPFSVRELAAMVREILDR